MEENLFRWKIIFNIPFVKLISLSKFSKIFKIV